jgi:hypothetical protein
VWRVFGSILGSKAGNVSIILLLDPFGRQIESHSDGDLEVWESCVFNIPFRGLIIGFLVIGHPVSKALDLFTKLVLHLMVDSFTGSNGFEQTVIDGA